MAGAASAPREQRPGEGPAGSPRRELGRARRPRRARATRASAGNSAPSGVPRSARSTAPARTCSPRSAATTARAAVARAARRGWVSSARGRPPRPSRHRRHRATEGRASVPPGTMASASVSGVQPRKRGCDAGTHGEVGQRRPAEPGRHAGVKLAHVDVPSGRRQVDERPRGLVDVDAPQLGPREEARRRVLAEERALAHPEGDTLVSVRVMSSARANQV